MTVRPQHSRFSTDCSENGNNTPAESNNAAAQQPPKEGGKPPKRKFLDNYCINLTDRARAGKLDNMVGREEELERVIQILNRRQKNNPCLIGEPGVGKTAVAEGACSAHSARSGAL